MVVCSPLWHRAGIPLKTDTCRSGLWGRKLQTSQQSSHALALRQWPESVALCGVLQEPKTKSISPILEAQLRNEKWRCDTTNMQCRGAGAKQAPPCEAQGGMSESFAQKFPVAAPLTERWSGSWCGRSRQGERDSAQQRIGAPFPLRGPGHRSAAAEPLRLVEAQKKIPRFLCRN